MSPYMMIFGRIVNREIAIYDRWQSNMVIFMDFVSREHEWADRAKRMLQAELKRAGVTYEELARRLRNHGLDETKHSVAGKVGRGTFPASFFLAAMIAIGRESVRLDDV
jgi:hypothetical protein